MFASALPNAGNKKENYTHKRGKAEEYTTLSVSGNRLMAGPPPPGCHAFLMTEIETSFLGEIQRVYVMV